MLKVDNVSKSYPTPRGDLPVLTDVSLTLDRGEAVAIMGPSGSGKSTLLYALGALEPPTSGTVTLDGVNPYTLGERAQAAFRNNHVGFVFQDHSLLPQCSVLENVLAPTLVAEPAATNDAEQRAVEILTQVGLGSRLEHRPSELSGGEKQRAAIARALIRNPTLLLCDEPTGDLDRKSGDEVLNLLQALNERHGKTIIMVTHDPHAAARASHTLHLTKGQLTSEPEAA
jgi:ABC-type antimicrobial peptide transport system, ATPase component